MNDISSWIFLGLGLGGGFGLSILFFWITNHILVPRLQFSVEVSKSEVEFYPSGVRHQIAIKNCGRRDAYNVKYRVKLKVRDVLHSGGKLWDFIDIETAGNEFFILKKGSMFRVTPVVHRTTAFSQGLFPKNIRDKYEEGTLSLDDLFNSYKEINIYLEAVATDRFSGGAKYFRSKEYSIHDIRKGVFRGNNHLSIHKQRKAAFRNDRKNADIETG